MYQNVIKSQTKISMEILNETINVIFKQRTFFHIYNRYFSGGCILPLDTVLDSNSSNHCRRYGGVSLLLHRVKESIMKICLACNKVLEWDESTFCDGYCWECFNAGNDDSLILPLNHEIDDNGPDWRN